MPSPSEKRTKEWIFTSPPSFLPELVANLFDGARGRVPHVVLTEQRDLGEPLGELAVEDLRPRRLGLASLP